MLLSVVAADRPDNRRLGLQTLIAADVVVDSRNVATRTIAASRRAVCLRVGQRYPEPFAEEEEDEYGECEDDEGQEGGCWVLYGWRRRLRRLPPLIPSLRRVGSTPWALTRTHAADGRVVIAREPAPQRGRLVARKLDGRLILDLVDNDNSPVPPPPRQRLPTHPPIEQETDVPAAADDDEKEENAISADTESAHGRDVPAAVWTPVVSPVGSAAASPVPAVACFEAVIRTSPRKVPLSVPRMVH